MSQPESAPRVMIFDFNEGNGFWMAQDGASQAGWQLLAYSDIDIAVDDFDKSISALIAATPNGKDLIEPLLEISDRLRIPRGILASRPNYASRYMRDYSADCFFQHDRIETRDRVKEWPTALALKVEPA